VRFHGIFAPHAAKRSLLAALVPTPAACATTPLRRADPVAATTSNATLDPSPLPAAPTPVPVPYRRPWAELLRRIHDHDVLRCPRCDGRMVPVQTVKDPAVIAKVLAHLGLPTSLPAVAAARAPPQLVFDLDEPGELELDLHHAAFNA
jgi:hypothetical protein